MGPLEGIKVVELAGLGPGPFAGMLLADLGADVLRVDRPGGGDGFGAGGGGALGRHKLSVTLDLKHERGAEAFLELVAAADALVDVFRPGVTERLGIGPAPCLARNPRLIYGRLTGYGQEGPLAQRAGHDIDYLAISGALEPLGRADQPPTPPINVLADFAGGGMLLAFGIAAALFERERSGQGQVVDAAMVDGAALLMAPFYAGRTNGSWGPRGTNPIDTGAPFYDVYETADGKWMAVGAIEPQFHAALVATLGADALGDEPLPDQWDAVAWAAYRARLTAAFKAGTRDEWTAAFAGVDACVEPVLAPDEAVHHPHAVARSAFAEVDGLPQPAAAPRFARTPGRRPGLPATAAGLEAALAAFGLADDAVGRAVATGALGFEA
jgi:alpha-methylacyl-CoA racemase